ncbi:MAG: SUMF1/EgtB/PvdO family nonheme iron enzyme [Pseudomonadota bacterium]|nr:SUMF1/EgtB/PvdO family nonheme iron enzyme [Pseudomonadota bacterium]
MDSLTRSPADLARQGDARWLADALQASRADTLATFVATAAALTDLRRSVPQRPQFNPPLWELGHIGWFQAHWMARQPESERRRGWDADPDIVREPAPRPNADALYDSSHVPHATRWSLMLPDADVTCTDLARQLEQSGALIAGLPHDDRALYFGRLVLLHEDMHHEASLYLAQSLGLPMTDARWQPSALPDLPDSLRFEASLWKLGSTDQGFAFDNEWPAHDVEVDACTIDAQVVRWAEFLPFIEQGGYESPRWWSAAGRDWLRRTQASHPLHLRHNPSGAWQRQHFGTWQTLEEALPACHLTAFEAEAWCAWAGRRLPTEAEWERAALSRPAAFRWGDIWEWTASIFAPYPGFVVHPYRDYSAPWFGSRPVLRGASFATQPRMRHARYRNYFTPERNDIFAGFRSCASGPPEENREDRP